MRANACLAAWYELNISSADDCVSACCYYHGEKDAWSNEIRPLADYWNSQHMQTIRRINGLGNEPAGGCEGCYFLNHRNGTPYQPDFFEPDPDWSPAQRANWELAVEDYTAGRVETRATPMRYYINFGFACNLSCTMCHQVPRRSALKRQVSADTVLAWREQMVSADDITVIGGEPFMLIEAIKFIRAIIEDPAFENVQLTICTNGTLHHRFMDLLRKKRKLALVVSLDSMGEEYEAIRVGSSWELVAGNIETFIATGQELGYPWTVQSPCMLLRTNIPRLEDYARWCIEHDIRPAFYDFVNARGIEETFESENIIAHPELLLSMEGWQADFERAIAVLQRSRFPVAVAQLTHLYEMATANLAAYSARRGEIAALPADRSWFPLYDLEGAELVGRLQQNFYSERGGLVGGVMTAGSLNDHVATRFVDVSGDWLRVTTAPSEVRSYLQGDDYRDLHPTETVETDAGTVRLYRLAKPQGVRLVWTGTMGMAHELPARVTIERGSRGEAMILLDEIAEPPALDPEPASVLESVLVAEPPSTPAPHERRSSTLGTRLREVFRLH